MYITMYNQVFIRGFPMDIEYLYKQYNKYWFQRRPPKKLQHLLGAKTIRLNLHTSDLSTAVAKRDAITHQWGTMLKENTPSESYQYHMSLWSRLKADITEQEAPLINPDIWNELTMSGAQTAVDAQKVLNNFFFF